MKKERSVMPKHKGLMIFFLIAFGMPVILGIFMGIGFHMGQNVSAFPLAWMYLPAAAAMISVLVSEKEVISQPPKAFFVTFASFAALTAVLAVVNVFISEIELLGVINVVIMISAAVCGMQIFLLKKERRSAWGLSVMKNTKKALGCIGIFLLLYLLMNGISIGMSLLMGSDLSEFSLNPRAFEYLFLLLPLNLVMSWPAFFGEEYGWRFFLQPRLQRRFGKRGGVILLGLVWGIWHLPLKMFYYSPNTVLQSVLVQLAGCVGMAVFFGWVQMRTENVWAVAAIHFLNNNLGVVIFGTLPVGVERGWMDSLLTIAIYMAVYLPFLGAKEYRL